jgi:hypothetical protein
VIVTRIHSGEYDQSDQLISTFWTLDQLINLTNFLGFTFSWSDLNFRSASSTIVLTMAINVDKLIWLNMLSCVASNLAVCLLYSLPKATSTEIMDTLSLPSTIHSYVSCQVSSPMISSNMSPLLASIRVTLCSALSWCCGLLHFSLVSASFSLRAFSCWLQLQPSLVFLLY